MATKAPSFENPLYQDTGGVPSAVVNPFGYTNAAASPGSDALRPDLSSLAVMGKLGVQLARQNQFTMPEMKEPSLAYSPSKNQLFVQGVTLDVNDAQGILDAQKLLGGAPTGLPTDGDWTPLDRQSYGQLVQGIKNPSLGTLAAKNFGRGVDVAQMLIGRGLQLAGAEETGGRIVAQQMEDLRRTTPYERQFTDIDSGRGAVEWLVANFAQQGPNMIESIATAGLGFLAGTAASGTPIGGAAAAFSSLFGKAAWKEGVKAALAKQVKGEALNVAERKLLREAAGIAGAVAASYGQNLATGAADIYGELREQGADANDIDARLKALAGSVPYAALETLPEFLLAGRVLRGVGAPTPMGVGASLPRRAGELLKRGVIGGGVGGTAEGTTELGQDVLLLKLSDQDLGTPENVKRLVNAFAAGFGVGGPIGAVANLRGKEPANILDPGKASEPTPGTGLTVIPPTQPPGPGTEVAPYYTPVTPMGPMPPAAPVAGLAGLPGPATTTTLGLPSPVPPVAPMGGPVILAGMGPNAAAVTRQDIMLQQQGNVPPGAPGTQGVLDVFGGAIPAQELALRMLPPGVQPVAPAVAPATIPTIDTAQGVLQFAPPAPEPTAPGAVGLALQRAQQQQQLDQLQQQRNAQLAAQREADLNRLANAAAAQRQLDLAQQQPAPEPMPTRQAGPTQPVQLDLFTRRQAPRPSRAEALRRGVPGAQPVAAPVEVPMTAAQRRAQLPLFTQEGEPSMAALKSAGRKETVKPAPAAPKAPASKPRTQRGLKKQAGVAAVEVKETPSATQKGKLKQGRVAERAQDNEGVRAGREAGKQPAPEVTAGGAQAGGRGKPVGGGAKPQEVKKEAPKGPKAEAASAAAPAVAEGPVALSLELADGGKLKVKDGQKLVDKLDRDIKKLENLLACLTAIR